MIMVISIVIGILLLGGFVASIIIFGGICNKSVIYYNSESDSDDFRDGVFFNFENEPTWVKN